jgi:hypothetical protein
LLKNALTGIFSLTWRSRLYKIFSPPVFISSVSSNFPHYPHFISVKKPRQVYM